jgi:hypothetical protein
MNDIQRRPPLSPAGRFSARLWRFGFASTLVGLVALVALAPVGSASPALLITHVAPYRGGVLPTSNLNVYGCHAKAQQVTAWHFNLHIGKGGGSDSATAKACSLSQFRLGSGSTAAASGSEEVSILIKIPHGTRNVTANVQVNYTAQIKESAGSPTGACPSTPFNSTSSSYYNGSGWSYSPTISHPVVFSNKTYFYYYENNGASGSCGAYSSLDGGIIGFMVASNGLAGYSLTPTVFQFGGNVQTYNSTYWSCYNYTLWNYGSWANGSGGCSNSNQTTHTYSYDLQSATYGTNSTMTFAGSTTLAMYSVNDFHSVDRSWTLFIVPFGSTSVSTYGFPHGIAQSSFNLATNGNGVTIQSITIT